MSDSKIGNPAVVGFAGFAITTLVLQFHNLGWCSLGPVLALALAFGGGAQLVAGLLCMKTGDNFAFCAFSAYGAFWIAMGVIYLSNHMAIHPSSSQDIGWFMLAWAVFTLVMWVGAMRIDGALALTFTTLLIGFVLFVLAHLVAPCINMFVDQRQAGVQYLVEAEVDVTLLEARPRRKDCRLGSTRGLE